MPATSARASFVLEEFRSATWANQNVRDLYGKVARDTRDQPIPTFFDDMWAVQAMVNERGALLGRHARAFRATVGSLMDLSTDLDMSARLPSVHLSSTDLGAEIDAAVAAIESYDTESGRVTLALWGTASTIAPGSQDGDWVPPGAVAVPTNAQAPTLSTSRAYSGTITLADTDLGVWENDVDGMVVRWLWGDTFTGVTGTNYTKSLADAGKSLRFEVVASNGWGQSFPAYSNSIAIVDVLRIADAFSPNGQVGVAYSDPLSATGGLAPYGWAITALPNGLSLSGSTISGTPSTEQSVNYTLTVTDALGQAVSLSGSMAIAAAPPPAKPEPSVNPSIDDMTPTEGQTLNGAYGTWSGNPTFTYRWLADEAPIAGATGLTLVVTAAMVGKRLRFEVSATNAGGTTLAATELTGPVAAAAVTNVTPPTISGDTLPGSTLTASGDVWNVTPDSKLWQWKDNGVAIAGATNPSFVTPATSDGRVYSVEVRPVRAGVVGSPVQSSNSVTMAAIAMDAFYITETTETVTGGGTTQTTTTSIPIGTGYTRSYEGTAYNPVSDIPAGAILLSAYVGQTDPFKAAVNAARSAGKALCVDVDMTVGTGDLGCSQVALYGKLVSGRAPKLTSSVGTSSTTQALMYLVDGSLTCKGIEFNSFGMVFACAVPSNLSPAYPYHDSSQYGRVTMVPAGVAISTRTGVGVGINTTTYPLTLGGVGPGFTITDCRFINCDTAFGVTSDSLTLAPSHFHRNTLIGTYGACYIDCTVVPDFYAANNIWTGCTGARIQKYKSQGCKTMFYFSPDKGYNHRHVRRQKIYIQNNYAKDIHDQHGSDGCNSAVFADLRNVNPATFTYGSNLYTDRYTATCSVVISHNHIENLVGTTGQEDCNAIYGKVMGMLIEWNRIINCGSADMRLTDPARSEFYDGSEASLILLKEPFDFTYADARAFVIIRNNDFRDIHGHRIQSNQYNSSGALVREGVPNHMGIKTDNYAIPVYFLGNHFTNWHTTVIQQIGLIRPTGTMAKGGVIEDNIFHNCAVGPLPANGLIYPHQYSGGSLLIRNNIAFDGPLVSYPANVKLINGSNTGVTMSGNKCVGAQTFSMETNTASAGSAALSEPSFPAPSGSSSAGGGGAVTTTTTIDQFYIGGEALYFSR